MHRRQWARWLAGFALAALLGVAPTGNTSTGKSAIEWQKWTPDLFDKAKAEKKFVLLDLEAVWCHWCHVMDQTTYADPAVAAELKKNYIAVKVDQDSRPDLSLRYEQYGWPATIIFGPDGTEIVKQRGYLEPDVLLSILQGVVEDPSPVPGIQIEIPEKFADNHILSKEVRTELEQRHSKFQDRKKGGIDGPYRYVPWEAIEYGLTLASQGNKAETDWINLTLRAGDALIDPAWGGVYQYSVKQSWDNPHFEKIMSFQAENLRTYAIAGATLPDPGNRKAAANITRYVRDFLTGENGAFYTSQDADAVPGKESDEYFKLGDKERRAKGIPRIDKNQYARENGWMIEALATSYEYLGEAEDLAGAETAAKWVLANRALPGGGFHHGPLDKEEVSGPFLGDTLAMGRAFLQLYRATSDPVWYKHAADAADFMEKNFRQSTAGYISAKGDGTPIGAVPQFDENIRIARFANLLSHYSGKEAHRKMAEHAARYIATKDIYGSRREIGGILLLDSELSEDPLHLTIVGPRGDAKARDLYAAALRLPGWYKRVEWSDPAQGALPNPDIQYPKLDKAAAFVCNNKACSRPLFAADELGQFIERDKKARTAAAGD